MSTSCRAVSTSTGRSASSDANLLEHLLAVLDRHVQIENGQIGHLLAKCLDGGSAIMGQANAMPVGLQSPAQKQSQRLVVFGNQ